MTVSDRLLIINETKRPFVSAFIKSVVKGLAADVRSVTVRNRYHRRTRRNLDPVQLKTDDIYYCHCFPALFVSKATISETGKLQIGCTLSR